MKSSANLAQQSVWQNIQKAKELGYFVEMYYVGIESADLAKERVKSRVLKGGHGIPDKDIERRFKESIDNLKTAVNICDIVEIFDNTNVFQRVARFESGKCIFKTETCPNWVP